MRGGNIAPIKSLLLQDSPAFATRRLLQCRLAKNSFVTAQSLLVCFDLSGTRLLSKFLMHSHRQSTNGPLQVFKYTRLSVSVNRFSRFNSGRICCTRCWLISIDFPIYSSAFILLERKRTVCRRRRRYWCVCDTIRLFPAANRSTGTRTDFSSHLYTPPPRICSFRDTSV
jgi:hypothetical protein